MHEEIQKVEERGVWGERGKVAPDRRPSPLFLVSLEGSPGDRVNLSCIGVSEPTRWAWAPSFPACQGLSKGRRRILWARPSGAPSVLPHFSGRLRSLDTGIERLELLLSTGDSGSFFCKGRQENESRTVLQVLGDKADCSAPGSAHGRERPRGPGHLTWTHTRKRKRGAILERGERVEPWGP